MILYFLDQVATMILKFGIDLSGVIDMLTFLFTLPGGGPTSGPMGPIL